MFFLSRQSVGIYVGVGGKRIIYVPGDVFISKIYNWYCTNGYIIPFGMFQIGSFLTH
jgi:hypothetical protein